jgi:hypothetical protein
MAILFEEIAGGDPAQEQVFSLPLFWSGLQDVVIASDCRSGVLACWVSHQCPVPGLETQPKRLKCNQIMTKSSPLCPFGDSSCDVYCCNNSVYICTDSSASIEN